jgi:hypothetical protein
VRRRGSHYFLDNRLTDGGELSALRASRPLLPERFLVLIFVRCVSINIWSKWGRILLVALNDGG